MKNTEIIGLLSELVEIPSISSLEENQKDVLESANFISDLFKKVGLKSKVTSSKNSKPAVLAQTEIEECMIRMGKETIQNIIDFFEKKLDKSKIIKL